MMEDVNRQPLVCIYDEYRPQDENAPNLSPIVILHAILDCKQNWKEVATVLSEETKRKVYVLDLSDDDEDCPSVSYSFNAVYKAVEDVLMKIGQPVFLIGHSLGAVIGILLATRQPKMVNRLVIIDVSPLDYPVEAEENILCCIEIMRQVLSSVPKGLSFQKTQNVIMKYFENAIPSEILRKVLLGNLIEGKNCIRWRYDLDIMEKEFKENLIANIYPLKCLCYTESLLIYAEASEFVSENDFNDMKVIFPKLKLYCIKDTSHWIHMEQPKKLIEVISEFLNEKEKKEKNKDVV